MSRVRILEAGPGLLVQDHGRPGFLARGLSRGGAADMLALEEGAAVLGRAPDAAIEMAGRGGRFEVQGGTVAFALTGARMRAHLDGAPVPMTQGVLMEPGQRLEIGGAEAGCYGYLSLGGGLDVPAPLRAKSVHLRAGIGRALAAGDEIEILPGGRAGWRLDVDDRLSGGVLRVVASAQTELFDSAVRTRFFDTVFRRGPRGNRMGVEIIAEGDGFAARQQLTILSEITIPGDIQMTGDGFPFVLGPECQTTGGYPRIATVVPDDLGRAFQAAPGVALKFELIGLEAAGAAMRVQAARRKALARRAFPAVRDPGEMADLLGYQLISGVTDGRGHES